MSLYLCGQSPKKYVTPVSPCEKHQIPIEWHPTKHLTPQNCQGHRKQGKAENCHRQ